MRRNEGFGCRVFGVTDAEVYASRPSRTLSMTCGSCQLRGAGGCHGGGRRGALGARAQEHLFLVCELLRANLYEFQKYNREAGDPLYFTLARVQSIARQARPPRPSTVRLKLLLIPLRVALAGESTPLHWAALASHRAQLQPWSSQGGCHAGRLF